MFDINNFYDLDGVIHLNKYKIVVRYYDSVEKQTYEDVTMFLNDEGLKDMKEQHIAKHQLLELISEEVIDTSDYEWMEGLPLQSDNPIKEIEEIYNYGSKEAYEASLPQAQDEFNLDMDYRMSKMELGL
jgi:hypothetical protein